MPEPINRREFINACFLTTIVPSAFAQKITYKATGRIPTANGLEKLKSIDSHFVSVDGWVLPKKTLIKGTL